MTRKAKRPQANDERFVDDAVGAVQYVRYSEPPEHLGDRLAALVRLVAEKSVLRFPGRRDA